MSAPPPPPPSQTYTGTCHCGHIRFSITSSLPDVVSCDCSICIRRGALIQRIPDAAFHPISPTAASLEDGTHGLIEYRFNTMVARDYICPVCGILGFRRPRLGMGVWAINVRCLEGVEVEKLMVRRVFGSQLSTVGVEGGVTGEGKEEVVKG
ncbi:hypothetical protein VE02_04545 [Pseudogymnoascus sp. 03VT05]|nr:hypothetical protein VE02_04545 [Pseudogymnoascus sp. 03VT05]